jgi:hypothetical protein
MTTTSVAATTHDAPARLTAPSIAAASPPTVGPSPSPATAPPTCGPSAPPAPTSRSSGTASRSFAASPPVRAGTVAGRYRSAPILPPVAWTRPSPPRHPRAAHPGRSTPNLGRLTAAWPYV